MHLGQASYDLPLTTVSQDPLSTVASNIPGLVMSAPDVLVGPTEPAPFPWWPLALVVATAFLLFTPPRRR